MQKPSQSKQPPHEVEAINFNSDAN